MRENTASMYVQLYVKAEDYFGLLLPLVMLNSDGNDGDFLLQLLGGAEFLELHLVYPCLPLSRSQSRISNQHSPCTREEIER